MIGEADDEWGERVVALVELESTARRSSLDELQAWTRPASRPTRSRARCDAGRLPRNAMGKVIKRVVR